jgi:hypothetical protein
MKTIFALTVAGIGSGVCFGLCVGQLSLAERKIDRLYVSEGLVFYGVLAVLCFGGIFLHGLKWVSRGDDE